MSHRKVTIIGAGHVGSHVALSLSFGDAADEIVLVDKDAKKAGAQALDIYDAISFTDHGTLVRGGDYADVQDADVVVNAIGIARKPGQDRVQMLDDSIVMCDELLESLSPYTIPGKLISITNPCDVIAAYIRRGLGLGDQQSWGTGTLLDTARLIRVISENTGVARSSIQGFTMGEHGESSMIPFSILRVGGVPYYDLGLDDDAVLKQVRAGGWDIVNFKLCTEFGIGRAAATMVEAVLRDEKKIFPASAVLNGEYGETGVQIGVPCIIGAGGIEKVLEVKMTDEEKAKFHASCDVVRHNTAVALEKGTRGVK